MMSNEFIKFGSPLIDLLVKLFNKLLDSGQFPDQWTTSSLALIHKSGDFNDCNNYIGISYINSLLGGTHSVEMY